MITIEDQEITVAFHSLYKWFVVFCNPNLKYYNWIVWYKNILYQEWFDSLTDEEQRAHLKQKEIERKRKIQEEERAWAQLLAIRSYLEEINGPINYWR